MNRRYTEDELRNWECLPTKEELANLPYDAKNSYIQILTDLESGVEIFYCYWNKHLIYAPSVTGPWRFDTNDALVLPEHLEELYPHISLIQNLQWLKKLSQCLAVLKRLTWHKSSKLHNNLKIMYIILDHLGFPMNPRSYNSEQNWLNNRQNKTYYHWDSFFTHYYFGNTPFVSA